MVHTNWQRSNIPFTIRTWYKKINVPNSAPFTTRPIVEDIWPYGDSTIVDKILDYTAAYVTLGLNPTDADDKLSTLLISLQYATNPTGNKTEQMDNSITMTEYKPLCSNIRQLTVSPPYKVHMDNYIVSCETKIAQVYLAMMNIKFHYGSTLNWWKNSYIVCC